MDSIEDQRSGASAEPFAVARFESFYEVARLGSVAKAAAYLHRSQPAISHRLRALQNELGVDLFEKVGRGLRLTEAGHRLRNRCGDFFAWSRDLRAAVTEYAEPEGKVVLGTLPTVGSHLLVDVVAELLKNFPRIQLIFVFDVVIPLLDALRTGGADVLVLVGDVDTADFSVDVLGYTELVAAMAPSLAPRGRGTIRALELRRLRYLGWEGPPDPTFDMVRRFVARERLKDVHAPKIPNIEALRTLASLSCGYTILPEYTVRRDVEAGRLVALKIAGLRDSVPILLVGRHGQLTGPALRIVRDACGHLPARKT